MPRCIMKSGFFKNIAHTTNYLDYMNKQGDLFTPDGETTVSDATTQTYQYGDSQAWRQIFSLSADDAQRLGIDQTYMKNLVSAKRDEIAAAYNIKPQNLILYASFHNKEYHPHLHMVFFSKEKREGFVRGTKADRDAGLKAASKRLKSVFANTVFREDLMDIKVGKAQVRERLKQSLLQELQATVQKETLPVVVRQQYAALSKDLRQHFKNNSGRKAYMYLPPELKAKVDDMLQSVVRHSPYTQRLFQQYADYQHELLSTYADSDRTKGRKMGEWTERFFHPGKNDDTGRHNAIIRAALQEEYRPKNQGEAASTLLWGVANTLRRDLARHSKQEEKDDKKNKKERDKKDPRQSNISHDDYLER